MIRYRKSHYISNSSGPQYTSHSQGKNLSEPQIDVDSIMNGDFEGKSRDKLYRNFQNHIHIPSSIVMY